LTAAQLNACLLAHFIAEWGTGMFMHMYVLELNDAPHKGKNFTKRGKKKMSNTQSGCPPWLKQAIMYLVSPPSTPLSKPPLFQIVEVCAWSSSLHLTNRRHSFIIISPHSTHSSHRHTNIGSRVTTMVCVERSNASNSCTCITYSNGSSTKVCIITTLYRYIYIYIIYRLSPFPSFDD
jgi:hypothetical protein